LQPVGWSDVTSKFAGHIRGFAGVLTDIDPKAVVAWVAEKPDRRVGQGIPLVVCFASKFVNDPIADGGWIRGIFRSNQRFKVKTNIFAFNKVITR
jgi:hypothetical protein